MKHALPLRSPEPNADEFIDVLLGRRTVPRVPLVEYIVDPFVMRPIITDVMGRQWVEPGADRGAREAYFDNFIAFWHQMGYDVVRFEEGLPFDEKHFDAQDPAPGSSKQRSWADQHHGTIATWEDFERFSWPPVEDKDFSAAEYIDGHLPEGMGFVSCHAGGIFEHLSGIMSLEGLCMAVYEQPDLVRAVADRVGETLLAYHRRLLEFDSLVAVFQGDDMGFRTGTLITPDQMRTYCLTWHKRFAAQAHEHGRPYFVHSCGNVESIMNDLIDEVGIDGKHSYEDAIIPVERFQERYGDRIAVLGGVDINILAGGSPDDVRARTRDLIETCGVRGRYAVGSGNSIPSYIPVPNYLAMVDEALTIAGVLST